MALERIVYLTEANYTTLMNNGSVTVGAQTVTYSNNDLYITPFQVTNILHGGTGVSSLTANSVLMSGTTTTSPITTRGLTDQTTAGTNPTANNNIITANTLMNYCGTTNISTVGTITSGTWNGNPVDTGFITSSTVAIPAAGNSVTKTLQGLTADYQLVRWNFSSSPENAPPASLTWTTGTNQFTITNNFGSTSQTIKPVFIKPTSKAIS